jgi:hypothetical protein
VKLVKQDSAATPPPLLLLLLLRGPTASQCWPPASCILLCMCVAAHLETVLLLLLLLQAPTASQC